MIQHDPETSRKLAESLGWELPPGAQMITVGLPGMQQLPELPAGPPRPTTYDFGGRVRKIREFMKLFPGEVEGRIPLAIETEYGDTIVAHFDPANRPKVDARVGLKGTWLVFDLDLEQVLARAEGCPCCEELARLELGQPVDHQLEVDSWRVVSLDFDFLFD